MFYKLALFLLIPLWGANLQISGVESTYIFDGKTDYIISAKKYINNFSKFKTSFLLNSEKFMLKNDFYQDGSILVNSDKVYFEKAYKLGGKVYLFNIKGVVKGAKIIAQKAIYYKKTLLLQKCEVITKNRVFRRRKYSIKF